MLRVAFQVWVLWVFVLTSSTHNAVAFAAQSCAYTITQIELTTAQPLPSYAQKAVNQALRKAFSTSCATPIMAAQIAAETEQILQNISVGVAGPSYTLTPKDGFVRVILSETASHRYLVTLPKQQMADIQRLLRDNRPAEAYEKLTAFVAQNPNLLSGRLMLAQALIQLNQTDEARYILQELADDPQQSEGGRATASGLLQRLDATPTAEVDVALPKKPPSGKTSFALHQRVGYDRNVRRLSRNKQITYHLNNLDVLANLNLGSIIDNAPGVVDETTDTSENEVYFETTVNALHSRQNLLSAGETWSFGAFLIQRYYDTYDDNNDGKGDGDYQVALLRSAVAQPLQKFLLGGNLSFSQLSLAGQAASRTTELSGNILIPIVAKREVPDVVNVTLTHQITTALARNDSVNHDERSSATWRLQSAYQAQRAFMDWQATARFSQQKHNNAQLDYNTFGLGVRGIKPFGKWQVSAGLELQKRIYEHPPEGDNFEAIWGIRRRHDDMLSVQTSIAYPITIAAHDVALSLDWVEHHSTSNIERYDIDTGDISFNISTEW